MLVMFCTGISAKCCCENNCNTMTRNINNVKLERGTDFKEPGSGLTLHSQTEDSLSLF